MDGGGGIRVWTVGAELGCGWWGWSGEWEVGEVESNGVFHKICWGTFHTEQLQLVLCCLMVDLVLCCLMEDLVLKLCPPPQ